MSEPDRAPNGTTDGLTDQEKREKEYKEMVAYLGELGEGRKSSIQELDKHTLTLASGAFGLSVAFGQFMEKPLASLGALQMGWFFLLGSVGATVLSLTMSTCSYWYLAHSVRRAYSAKRNWRECDARELRYSTRALTMLGPVLFFIGMIYLSIFAYSNLGGSGNVDSRNRRAPETITADTTTSNSTTATSRTNTAKADSDPHSGKKR